jgi:hypothetical protein
MSKSEILGQLSNLGRTDRREILERIREIEEPDLLKGAQPDPDEQALLDRELKEYQANPNAGAECKDVELRLRRQLRP